jgi:TetR/AcrR family transcriptional repressor of nem operon
MVKIENSKRTIMNMAEALLQDKGFNGFSYAHIATELGVKNAAIHYHFPTKEALGIAVVKRYRDRFQLWINNSRIKNLSPEKKLDWFFSIYSDMRADKGKVCLVGSMEAEFNSIPDGLREEVEGLHKELLRWLEATLDEGREGALQMARALGTKKFRDVVEQHKLDLLA